MPQETDPAADGFRQIAQLFELSLSIGTSLNLQESCERFLSVLMARKNLAFAAVWLRSDVLAESRLHGPSKKDALDELQLVWGSPEVHIRERGLPKDHALLDRVSGGPFSFSSDDSDWTALRAEAPQLAGRCAVFPLGQLGVLKLISLTSKEAFSGPEIGQLDTLIRKFSLSLEACLSHEQAIADRRDHDRLVSILENTADLVGMADPKGKITYLNRAGRRLAGIPIDEDIRGLSISDFHQPDVADMFLNEALPCAVRDETWAGETRFLSRTGIEIPCLQVVMHHGEGAEEYFSTIARDITERVRLEEQLRHAHKLEAVGQLAAGVAHDFNNLLTAIMGHSHLLRRTLEGHPRQRQSIDSIVTACEGAADLTDQLLSFSRRQPIRKEAFCVDELVQDAITLLARTFDPGIAIESDLATADWTVDGDRSQMKNVFINLAVNARDVMPDGGTLRFTTRAIGEGAAQEVEIEVRDSGAGMDAATQARIFEPFFTTKTAGSGTGLGLAVAYGTVQAHGGAIEVESALGNGTVFTIRIPAKPLKEASQESELAMSPEAMLGKGRVLVVDDEEIVRGTVTKMLESLGYEVETASDGNEALEMLKTMEQTFSAVVLDLMMPGLDGAATLRELRQLLPSLPVLMVSGYGHERLLEEVDALGVDAFLRKPFTLAALSKELVGVLQVE